MISESSNNSSFVTFDEIGKLRILAASKSDSSHKLKEECSTFSNDLSQLVERTSEIKAIMQKKSDALEQQKFSAIGMRNAVLKERQNREPMIAMLQASIRDKQTQIDKLNIQQQSLDKVIQDQQDLIDFLGSR